MVIPRTRDQSDWGLTKELMVGLLAYQLTLQDPLMDERTALLAAKEGLLRLRKEDATAKRVLELCQQTSERARNRSSEKRVGGL